MNILGATGKGLAGTGALEVFLHAIPPASLLPSLVSPIMKKENMYC